MFWKEKNERKEKEIFRRNMRRNNQFTNEMKISRTIFVSRLSFYHQRKRKRNRKRERKTRKKNRRTKWGKHALFDPQL